MRFGKSVFAKLDGSWLPVSTYRLLDDVEGGDGDTGEGSGAGAGSQGDQSTPRTEGEEGTSGRVAGDTGGSGQMIPKARFDEVLNQLKAFKAYGTPEQIAALKEKIAWMEANPGKRFNEKQLAEINSELMAVPTFARMAQNSDRFERFLKLQEERFYRVADTTTDKFLKDLGHDLNDENRSYLSHTLAGIIQADKKLLERFVAHDHEVFEDAFKMFKKLGPKARPVIPGMEVQRTKVGRQPLPPSGKKTAPNNNDNREKSERELLDEAGDNAFAALMGSAGEE